jgi:hypothetical protein
VSLDPARTGEALLATAGELHRIWRSARAELRPDVFPGLADGAVGALLDAAARALAAGGADPEAIYAGVGAVVRIDPRDRPWSEAEVANEWRLAREVLRATCAALDAAAPARDLLVAAAEAGARGAAALVSGRGPAAILVVAQRSGFAPPRRSER